jgi:hypothetical protein
LQLLPLLLILLKQATLLLLNTVAIRRAKQASAGSGGKENAE